MRTQNPVCLIPLGVLASIKTRQDKITTYMLKHTQRNAVSLKTLTHKSHTPAFVIFYTSQGFFSKFLMGGDSKFLVPIGPRRGRSRMGGGTCEKNPTEAKTAHLVQN